MHVQQPTTAAVAVDPVENLPPNAVVEKAEEVEKNPESSTSDKAPPMIAVQNLDRQEAEEKKQVSRVGGFMQKPHRIARDRLESEGRNFENARSASLPTIRKFEARRLHWKRK